MESPRSNRSGEGPVKVTGSNFIIGQTVYLDDFDISRDHADIPDCLKEDKFKTLADAVSLYLNGDYKSIVGNYDEESMLDDFKSFKDVDEWENEAGSNIMAMLEEGVLRQEHMDDKEVIIDDIDDLDGISDYQGSKNNRVTTVIEE